MNQNAANFFFCVVFTPKYFGKLICEKAFHS